MTHPEIRAALAIEAAAHMRPSFDMGPDSVIPVREDHLRALLRDYDEAVDDLLTASSMGMAMMFSHLGPVNELSPYQKEQWDKFSAFHAKCKEAFDRNAARQQQAGQKEGGT